MEKIYKAGRTELGEKEVKSYYEEKKFICNGLGIYQIFYSSAQQDFYLSKIHHAKIAGRGRFYALTAAEVNHILGAEVLV